MLSEEGEDKSANSSIRHRKDRLDKVFSYMIGYLLTLKIIPFQTISERSASSG